MTGITVETRPDNDQQTGVRAFLQRVETVARDGGRGGLAESLRAQRVLLDGEDFTVLVVGEFGRGKSALVNALLGVPIVGVSGQQSTLVPTFVRYGDRPRAFLVSPADPGRGGTDAQPQRSRVPIDETVRLSLADRHPSAGRYAAVEVELPREVLREGLVVVDTAGVGGGFTAVAAARTIRTLSFADALVFVTDASAELTAPEVEFVAEAVSLCPVAVCVVTKTDLYPQWRRIVELNRGHLAAAGLSMPVLAVSSLLRELSLDTGDPSLAAESGFPILVRALTDTLRVQQRTRRLRDAAGVGAAAVDQLIAQTAAEYEALTDPDGRRARSESLRDDEQRAAQLHRGLARWQETLSDEMRAIRRSTRTDLTDRLRVLRTQATDRTAAGDPLASWGEFQPWLYHELNVALVAHHRALLEGLHGCADRVAAEFGAQAAELVLNLPMTLDLDAAASVTAPKGSRGSWLDMSLAAARGFSLSSSVVGITLIAVSAPVALVSLPLTAVLGSLFAARSVHATRQAQLRTARAEADRAVSTQLDESGQTTTRLDEELVDAAYKLMRNQFSDLADDVRRNAQAIRQAAEQAAATHESQVSRRNGELLTRRRTLQGLREAAARALAAPDELVATGRIG
ncbi:dynamin family protein [Acidothermaceae bacterium B102]|nr:dynamin family protein [Acidothermaceae bacterium B102]